jgi:hypothetical protein
MSEGEEMAWSMKKYVPVPLVHLVWANSLTDHLYSLQVR